MAWLDAYAPIIFVLVFTLFPSELLRTLLPFDTSSGIAAVLVRLAIPALVAISITVLIFRAFVYMHQRRAFKARTEGAKTLLERKTDGQIETLYVYLRPFHFDSSRFDWFKRSGNALFFTFKTRFDEELALAIDSLGVLLCLGHDRRVMAAGAPRLTSTDETWRQDLLSLLNRATGIVLVPSMRGGTFEELELIVQHKNLLSKTVFFLPPAFASLQIVKEWDEFIAYMTEHGIHHPFPTNPRESFGPHCYGVLYKADGQATYFCNDVLSREQLASAMDQLFDGGR